MLERQGTQLEDYSRDQKAYMNMLNRLYTAAKEGEVLHINFSFHRYFLNTFPQMSVM